MFQYPSNFNRRTGCVVFDAPTRWMEVIKAAEETISMTQLCRDRMAPLGRGLTIQETAMPPVDDAWQDLCKVNGILRKVIGLEDLCKSLQTSRLL